MFRDQQRESRGKPGGRAITEIGDRGRGSALARQRDVGSPGVDADILGRREKHDRHRADRDGRARRAGFCNANSAIAMASNDLHRHNPSPASPEQRQRIPIHERRPEEFQQIRQRHVRHHADFGVRSLRILEPRLQRALGQLVRVTGCRASTMIASIFGLASTAVRRGITLHAAFSSSVLTSGNPLSGA